MIVAAVADEEVGSVGTEALVRRTTADAAIVAEPTEEVVAVAHKGFVAFEVETVGRAAHGSRPDLGIDAIAAMGPVLSGIAALDARLRAGAVIRCSAPAPCTPRVIEGGQEYSSYPARCLLKGERRTIPGETSSDVRRELEEIVAGTGATVQPAVPPRPVRDGEPMRRSSRLCTGTSATTRSAASRSGPTRRCSPTPASRPSSSARSSADIHGVDEWVDLASLERCHDAYLAVAGSCARETRYACVSASRSRGPGGSRSPARRARRAPAPRAGRAAASSAARSFACVTLAGSHDAGQSRRPPPSAPRSTSPGTSARCSGIQYTTSVARPVASASTPPGSASPGRKTDAGNARALLVCRPGPTRRVQRAVVASYDLAGAPHVPEHRDETCTGSATRATSRSSASQKRAASDASAGTSGSIRTIASGAS